MLVGIVADNLHRVLVSTYSTIGTEAVELSFEHASATQGNLLLLRQRGEGYIVHDTYGEVILRLGQGEVFIDRENLSGSGVV